jgi:hypothetical protein
MEMDEKITLDIRVEVDSFEKGKELLSKLEVLQEEFKLNVELTICPTSLLFQATQK